MSRPTGRPPKPTHLKVIQGNPGKRRLAEPVKARPERPRCPAYLTPYAKTVWKRLVPILDEIGILTGADRDTLAAYCQAVATFKESTEQIAKTGLLVKRRDAVVKNPLLQVQRDAARSIATYSAMFGLSPADRVRLAGSANPGAGALPELEEVLGA